MKPSLRTQPWLIRQSSITVAVVITSSLSSAWAATPAWTAGGIGNFGDSTKYTPAVAPVAGDTVNSDGAGSTIGFDATNSINLAALNLNLTSGATTFNQTAGNLSLGTLGFGGAGGSRNPVYNMSGGTLTISTNFTWGNGSNAKFNVSAGTVDFSGTSLNLGVANGAKSSIIMTGGVFNANSVGQINLANAAVAGAQAVVDLSGNAQFNATASTFVIGQFGASTGTGVFATLNMAGTSQLNTSTVVLGGNNAGSAVYGVINLNGGAISTGSIRKGTSSIAASSTANVLNADGGSIKATTHANNSDFLAGTFVNLNAGGLVFDTNGNNVGISNVMSGTGGLTKSNTSGILTLSGVSTYAGGTTVNGGTLALAGGGGSGAIRGALTINSGATVNLTAGNALGFNGGAKVNSIAVNGGTLSAASGTGDQGWGISYTLTGGTIQSNGGISDAAATSNLTLDANSSVSTLASSSSSNIGGRVILRGDNGSNINFTVADGAASTDLLVSAAITNKPAFPTAGFTKLGSGVMALTGASTYTGATVVSAGTLLVNGSLGNTAVSVTAATGTATLGGSGVIGDVGGTQTVTVGGNGILAPGNSPGTLTVNGNVTVGDGTYAYQYTGAAGAGGAADLVDVNGTLLLANATLTLEDLGTYTLGNKFTLFAYDAISGTFNDHLDDTIFSANGGNWFINYDDDQPGVNGGTGTAFVTVTAVPEPSAAFIGLLGALGILRRRR
ncbi:MAG: autotransporter-associated beta strand repeat-containing protein [Luteolibacter sp.]